MKESTYGLVSFGGRGQAGFHPRHYQYIDCPVALSNLQVYSYVEINETVNEAWLVSEIL